jgi:hypothetical protein
VNLPKSNAVSEMGEHLTEKDFDFVGLESVKALYNYYSNKIHKSFIIKIIRYYNL